MKALILGLIVICSSALHANSTPLLLDAACSYNCEYVAEQCYDGCWEVGATRKKYVNYSGLSLEAIEQKRLSKEIEQVCLKTLPELEQWQTDAKFSKVGNFECHYFKH